VAVPQEGLTLEEFLKLPDESPALEFHHGRVTRKVSPQSEALPANPKVQESFIGI
jgi:hypothetical protein